MNLELKRLIYDFNYLIGRINKAESIPEETINKYSEAQYMKLVNELQKIIRQASEIEIKIERMINQEKVESLRIQKETGKSIEEITDIIKENSIGFSKAMEVLTVIDAQDNRKCYMFYRKIEEMKEE